MMGIPISELYQMTEYEFTMYKVGYQKRQVSFWSMVRFVAWMIQAVASSKPLKIEEVMELPGDKEKLEAQQKAKKAKAVTPKQYQNLLEKLGKNKK